MPDQWLKEFYPVSALEVKGTGEGIRHSLQKWRGLTPENLTKYGATPDASLRFVSAETCALCMQHKTCKSCPLVAVREAPCDTYKENESYFNGARTPWDSWLLDYNPGPMIKLLEQALELYELRQDVRYEPT